MFSLAANKKGGYKILVSLVMIVLVTMLLFNWSSEASPLAKEAAEELICKEAVIGQNVINTETDLVKHFVNAVNLFCKTYERSVPNRFTEKNKIGTMESVADLSAKAWEIFAEGLVYDKFVKDSNDRMCYTLFKFKIDENDIKTFPPGYKDSKEGGKLKPMFTGYELDLYMNLMNYKVKPLKREICGNGKDDDLNGEIDDDLICGQKDINFKSPCFQNGGMCMTKCNFYEMDHSVQSDYTNKGISGDESFYIYDDPRWECIDSKTEDFNCCVPESITLSYADYLSLNGGNLIVETKDNDLEPIDFYTNQMYAITVMIPSVAERTDEKDNNEDGGLWGGFKNIVHDVGRFLGVQSSTQNGQFDSHKFWYELNWGSDDNTYERMDDFKGMFIYISRYETVGRQCVVQNAE